MDILLIGGTVFVGRHLAQAAIERGHRVTIFHRGQHPLASEGPIEELLGDRDGALDALDGRRWDAAIDTCGYLPRQVQRMASALASRVSHYTFISTISVYADFSQPGIDERYPTGVLEAAAGHEEVTNETYGPLKWRCEEEAEAVMPGRTLVVRPGMIVGPYDPTDRFTYWVRRVARGGEVLAPGAPDAPQQFIDARDLAHWTLDQVERGRTGTYNATGPGDRLDRRTLLETCREVSGSDATCTWVDDSFLAQQAGGEAVSLPFWVPDQPEWRYIFDVDISRAVAAGLAFRPLAETIRDTLAWDAALPAEAPRPSWLGPEREAALLAAWRRARPAEPSGRAP